MGSVFSFLFRRKPKEYNATNDNIKEHHEKTGHTGAAKEKAEADPSNTNRPAEGTVPPKAEAKKPEEEAFKNQSEAQKRRADTEEHEEVNLAELDGLDVEGVEPGSEESKKQLERVSRGKDLIRGCEDEANAGTLAVAERDVETQMAVDNWKEQAWKFLELMPFRQKRLGGGIQPEVWPTEQEFQTAKKRIQYDPEKLHFAVCGSSGSGKSSFVNACCGLKNSSPNAAGTGIVETTKTIARYPDPRKEMPYNRLVWYDCPGAGTLKVPGWQYFNEQGLFIFDIIVLVYDARFTEIDVTVIRNCERFNIPLFIVRSKADSHMRNIMRDLGYDETDDDSEDNYEEYQERARQLLMKKTRKNVEANLKEAGLAMHDIFIISSSVIYSLVIGKKPNKKKTPVIDEARLIDSVLKAAYGRRYNTTIYKVPSLLSIAKKIPSPFQDMILGPAPLKALRSSGSGLVLPSEAENDSDVTGALSLIESGALIAE